MKKLFFITLILLPSLIFAQKLNQTTMDPKKNNEMLVGYCNREGFSSVNCNFDSAYKAEYPLYHPDEASIKQLAKKIKGIRITLVMATWCGDSKEWVPRFYKIMDELGYNYKKLTVISVNRNKEAPETTAKDLKIERVPTFIFYRNKVEIGRIVETPSGLLEKDILSILSK